MLYSLRLGVCGEGVVEEGGEDDLGELDEADGSLEKVVVEAGADPAHPTDVTAGGRVSLRVLL